MTIFFKDYSSTLCSEGTRAWVGMLDSPYIELRSLGTEGRSVSVDLTREDVYEWITTLSDIYDAMPESKIEAPEGVTKVRDRDGDMWERSNDDSWHCTSTNVAPRYFDNLVRSFGPVTPLTERVEVVEVVEGELIGVPA